MEDAITNGTMESSNNSTASVQQALRVGFVRYPPAVFNSCAHFPELGIRRKCPLPGFCVEIVKVLGQSLKIPVVPVVLAEENNEIDVGTQHGNGSWSGVLGAILNGTVDTACIFYQNTETRAPYFDFSTPIYTTQSRIAVRSQTPNEMWRLFKPYTLDSWLIIVGLLLLQMLAFMWIERAECRMCYRQQSTANLPRLAWRTLRMQLLQPEAMHFHTTAGKIQLIIFGLIQCSVITSIYQFWIVSSLVQSKPISPIKDGSQLLKNLDGRYRLVSQYKGHWFYEKLQFSTDFPFKEMREIAKKQPISWAHSINEALQLIEKGDHVLLLQGDDPAFFMAAHFCNIVFVDRELPSMTSHLAFAKGNPIREQIDAAIQREGIQLRRIYERYRDLRTMIRNQECEEQMAKSRRYQPLALMPILGVLLLYALYIAIACFVLLAEKFRAMDG